MFRALDYFIRRGFKSIWNNRAMSLTSVGIVAAGLLLFGVFLLIELNINTMLDRLENQCEINVYLAKDAQGVSLNQIVEKLKTIDGVEDVRFFSKEERLNRAKETTYKGREAILADFEKENPLRDSYVLSTEELDKSREIAAAAAAIPGVDEVVNQQDMIDWLQRAGNLARKLGVLLMLFLVLVAMFLVSSTIRLGLVARSREIGIMRFVGASNWYIRGPFMTEGILLGLMGAAVAVGLVLWGYFSVVEIIVQILQLDQSLLVPPQMVCKIVLISFLGIGTGIGMLGSAVSMRKYLKV